MFFVTAVVQFWNRWGFQISVLASLAANLLLTLLSGTRRRRSPYGWRSLLQWAAAGVLWVAYQVADVATTSAVGNLSLSGPDATTDEQQLVAFWAPFLLLHLGGPDNMTAYSLEDNKLSARTLFDMVLYIVGVTYAVYNYLYHDHRSWLLFAASVIMLVVGAVRYVEKLMAMWGANLDNMEEEDSSSKNTERWVESRISKIRGGWGELGDGEALLLAQDLFPVWRRALMDSSVKQQSSKNNLQRASEMIFSLERWEDMWKVVEMELSLMYDLLYTKAAVAHTWRGYLIRFFSPPATAAAAWLFWLWLHGNGRRIGASFVNITYTLLGATFAVDVWWVLRALGSTWTYAFLKARPQWACLHHQMLCAGRWHRLHRAVGYLDPISYRRWSGTIGRYNLLRECTTTTTHPGSSWSRWLATKAGLYLSELPEDVKNLLLRRLRQILPTDQNSGRSSRPYDMRDIMTLWGKKALEENEELFRQDGGEVPEFGKEFEQDVLLWHIATCVFLLRGSVKSVAESYPSSSGVHVAAIGAISEYLMFLVAKRRQMLPGLVLHSLLEATRAALDGLWGKDGKGTDTGVVHAEGSNEKRLVTILRRERIHNKHWAGVDEGKQLLSDALALASVLTKNKRAVGQVRRVLDFIFKVWVDKLLYAGARCSREYHAQQLSRGGELTTVLWIIVHHAGPFRIGEPKPALRRMMPVEEKKKPEEKKPEEKKKPTEEKKPAEEKKKKETEEKTKKGEPDKPAPRWPPHLLLPMPMPEQDADPDEMRIPEDEDPEDAQESNVSVEYSTLY